MRWFLLAIFWTTLTSAALEIRSSVDFDEKVRYSSRVFVVEFYSDFCGFCAEFSPTWRKFVQEASRLESARVNVDDEDGAKLASDLGVLDLGIPAVLIFTTETYLPLMAGQLFPVSRLLKLVYRETKAKGLSIDRDGYFLKTSS